MDRRNIRGGLWHQGAQAMRMQLDDEEEDSEPDEDHITSTDTLPISVNDSVNDENVLMLANRLLPSKGHTPAFDGENPNAQTTLRRDREQPPLVLQERYEKWIKSMPKWQNGLGRGWKGVRVLGRGGNGIAGLWQYVGAAKEKQSVDDWDDPEFIVVKQQRARKGFSLKEEADIMKRLNGVHSQHIPRIYKRCYREPGAGTPGMSIDSSRREVHRILMEYCPGGDMHDFICHMAYQPTRNWKFLREDNVWAILVCLAKALMAIEYGTEEPAVVEQNGHQGWSGKRSVHFDIKPSNRRKLYGKNGTEEHRRMPVFKLGDYGMMEVVRSLPGQSLTYVATRAGWGTRFSLAPEQHRFSYGRFPIPNSDPPMYGHRPNQQLPTEQRKYGSHTNVYQIGVAMYILMTLYWAFPERSRTFVSDLNPHLIAGGETIGEALVAGIFPPDAPRAHSGARQGLVQKSTITDQLPTRLPHPYSRTLCAVVLECLMQDYRQRPAIVDLLHRAESGYTKYVGKFPNIDYMSDGLFGLGPIPHDGETPARWKSNTPTDEWRKDNKGGLKPLSIVLRRQEHDRKRHAQILEAKDRMGWLNTPGARALIPMVGVKHGRSANDSDYSAEVEPDYMDAMAPSRPVLQLEPGQALPAAAPPRQGMPSPPRPRKVANPIHTPQAKRQRVTHPLIDLRLMIYMEGTEVRRHDYRLEFRGGDTIGQLKEKLVRDGVVPFSVEETRVARRLKEYGEEGFDLSNRMVVEDAAEPQDVPNKELRVGMLVVFRRLEQPDVTMAG